MQCMAYLFFLSFLSSASSSLLSFLLSLSSLSTAVSSEFFWRCYSPVFVLCCTVCYLELYGLSLLFTSHLVVFSSSTHTSARIHTHFVPQTPTHTYAYMSCVLQPPSSLLPLRRSCHFVTHICCFSLMCRRSGWRQQW